MSAETVSPQENLTPPPGFEFNDKLIEDYDEQVRSAIQRAEFQARPLPSFESIPKLDITPTFNPTGAPAEEIYAHDRVPTKFRKLGVRAGSEWATAGEPVTMWRILEQSRLEDGSGLVSSRIMQRSSLGDVESFDHRKHLSSVHERRMDDENAETPFVSFATDPADLAKQIRAGFGTQEGSDPVVVQVNVAPGRILTHKSRKQPEVLLIGGVAPEEYAGAYSVENFLSTVDAAEASYNESRSLRLNRTLGHDAIAGVMETRQTEATDVQIAA